MYTYIYICTYAHTIYIYIHTYTHTHYVHRVPETAEAAVRSAECGKQGRASEVPKRQNGRSGRESHNGDDDDDDDDDENAIKHTANNDNIKHNSDTYTSNEHSNSS